MVRFKNRYALCELMFPGQPETSVESHQVYQAVKASLLDSHGDFGLAALQSSLSVKYLNIKTNIAVIRGERRHFDMLTSSLVFIRKIGGKDVVFKTLHVGGSIRSCQKFLIGHHRKNLTQIFPSCKTPEERAEGMKSIMAACDTLDWGYSVYKQTPSQPAYSALSMLQEGDGDEEKEEES
ncbi:ribonuclease p/mrp protein subunit pop5 [Plakobranchus ocellatus]|uniref:Ribonuclease p/mrp protein subunit pop5 n=1 Tax=Plakobranchus ocellatus TaxID=259542 RepID=A0AAV4BDJ9_9GAST|nr:ribonuclease p/mrp protein subunit pop5 [Plakobranchus ocellatus]